MKRRLATSILLLMQLTRYQVIFFMFRIPELFDHVTCDFQLVLTVGDIVNTSQPLGIGIAVWKKLFALNALRDKVRQIF